MNKLGINKDEISECINESYGVESSSKINSELVKSGSNKVLANKLDP
jgi:hypothetical protein